MSDSAASKAERRPSKQEMLHSLAGRRYTPRRTSKGEPYVTADGVMFFTAPRRREALRADLCHAWRGDPGCDGEPPGDALLNREIAVMERIARDRDQDEPTPREVTDSLIAETGSPVLDEHPDRHKVFASGRNPFDVAREVADYLLKQNEPPRLFAMGPAAAVLLMDDGTLEGLDQDGWLAYVAERVDFLARTQDGDRIIAPPIAAMKILVPVIVRELPQLDGVTKTPYLDAAGNLIASDGYHPGTRLVLFTDGLRLPPVSDAPTQAEVAAAVELLTEQWLGDFPFATPADQANLVAELLTITGREMFPLAPMFVHDASTAGSGKGLLLLTLSVIATGEPAEVMELPADGDEQRKTVTSVLMAGKLLVAWDELHIIQGRTLAAILTAEIYSGRILGVNKLATVRNKLVQIALGNNVEVRGDLKRRVVPSRLVPKEAHPEHRTDFKHPDLKAWVREHRGELLGAAYTLWRNWIGKGRRAANVTLGSFEHWARTVGGVLQAAGIEGFLSTTTEWLSYSDDDDGWPTHVASLRRYFVLRWFTAGQVADAVNAGHVKRPPVKRDPDRELASQIAYAYRSQRQKRQGNNLRLIRSRERDSENGSYTWAVREDQETDEPDDGKSAEKSGVSGGANSSPASPGSTKPQVRSSEPSGDAGDGKSHLQAGGAHLQNPVGGETAGQKPVTEDAEHPDDKSGPSSTPPRAHANDDPEPGLCIAPRLPPHRARRSCATCWAHREYEPLGRDRVTEGGL
jgi:hypothetical protein